MSENIFTPEKAGLPEKNFTFEYAPEALNDIEELIQAMYASMDTTENLYMSEWYTELTNTKPEEDSEEYADWEESYKAFKTIAASQSPMERLVVAHGFSYGFDEDTICSCLINGGHASPLKRLAGMIRRDFGGNGK